MIVHQSKWERKLCPVLHFLATSHISYSRESHVCRLWGPLTHFSPSNEIHSQRVLCQDIALRRGLLSLLATTCAIKTHRHSNPVEKSHKIHWEIVVCANNGGSSPPHFLNAHQASSGFSACSLDKTGPAEAPTTSAPDALTREHSTPASLS